MKKHAEIGGKILANSDIELVRMARSIALTHHEKWDGTGYPRGLEGEGIPIEGRICAVADVFDALTSARPYKEPWSKEKAIETINEPSGKHFDPMLVNLFNVKIDEIIKICDKYADDTTDDNETLGISLMKLAKLSGADYPGGS